MDKSFGLILLIIAMVLHTWNSSAQNLEYSKSVKEKIEQVEDSIIVWGKTYLDVPRLSLQEWMKEKNVPGVSIAVINDFQIEWAKGWGWADIKEQIPVTTETAFRTGSVNKSINAFAFLKLKQDGGINFDEDINNILTSWKFPYTRDKPITTYHLLSHTSGIWYHWTSSHDHNLGPFKPTLIDFLDRKKSPQDKTKPYVYVERDPGLKYVYTNVGISVSQQVLIDATGMPYEDYVRQEVFEPLGMFNSFYVLDKKKHSFASGYRWNGKRVAGKYRPVVEYAPAGLWTTATDLAKYVIELQLSYRGESNKVLTKENTDYIFTYVNQDLPKNHLLNAGLGSFINNRGDSKYFFHDGEGSGYTAMFIGSFEDGKGAAILTNGENWGLVHAIASRIAEVYNWKDYHWDEVEQAVEVHQWSDYSPENSEGKPTIEKDELAKYTGRFSCSEHALNEVEIDVYEGKLRGRFTGGDYAQSIFFPLEPDVFWAESQSIYSYTKISFESNGQGGYDSFVLTNPDITTNWKRVVD